MTSFIALYRGETIGSARLVTATADFEIVHDFAERMLSVPETQEPDAVLRELEFGRQRALRLVRDGAEG